MFKKQSRISFGRVAFWCLLTPALIAANNALADSASLGIINALDDSIGSRPTGSLELTADGGLYGVTEIGGVSGNGVIYRLDPGGAVEFIDSVALAGGETPSAGLLAASDGNIYGMTVSGTNNAGIIYKVTPGSGISLVHEFTSFANTGSFPRSEFIQASDGNMYATTSSGGDYTCGDTGCSDGGGGTIIRLGLDGQVTKLHVFLDGNDGVSPYAGLVEASDGHLYGTTRSGGAFGRGTVYRFDLSDSSLTTLHSFSGESGDGAWPTSRLAQGPDGMLYGTTSGGGVQASNCSPSSLGCGTVFRISLAGAVDIVHAFRFFDGAYPSATVTFGANGGIFGTTPGGGNLRCPNGDGCGSFYRIDADGHTALFAFGQDNDGYKPSMQLTLSESGTFIGTAWGGGPTGNGQIYELRVDPGNVAPVIFGTTPILVPRFGSVRVFGQNLSRTTAALAAGNSAGFTVVSDNEISVQIPADVFVGKIFALTPDGAAVSPRRFFVTF